MRFFIIVLVFLQICFAYSASYYVAPNGSGAGTSWSTAFTNIQAALNTAGSNDTIYIAGRTYLITNSLVWSASASYVNIYGGYAATSDVVLPGPRDVQQWPTVIKRSSGLDRLLTIVKVTNGVMDGITLAGGYKKTTGYVYGGGILATNCVNLILANCVIASNRAETTTWHGYSYGGGIACVGGSVTITNCVITRNKAFGYGDWTSDAGYGGGICTYNSVVLIRDSILCFNEADNITNLRVGQGGALYANGTVTLRNCLIYANRAYYNGGDGIRIVGGTTRAEFCTIANHPNIGVYRTGGTVSVSNSVVWDCGDDISGTVTLGYCNIEDGDSGTGCFSSDPRFEYGYYLGEGSPCIDAGSITALGAGLSGYTTRANGANDTGTADIGYHYFSGMNLDYADLYVAPPPLGNDGNVGTNPAAPLATITAALGKSMNGTRIHIAAGTYAHGAETFPLKVEGVIGIALMGTNAGTTVINASGSNKRVFTATNAPRIRIENISFVGGRSTGSITTYGGGFFAENSGQAAIRGCVFVSNRVDTSGWHCYGLGGGVCALSGSIIISNCVFSYNRAIGYGDFTTDTGRGGALYISAYALVRDCKIYYNEADNVGKNVGLGGGLYGSGEEVFVKNCLLYGNRAATSGDAVYCNGGILRMEYCTVANHSDDGIYRYGGTVSVSNSIVWDCGDDIVGTVTLGYCDIEDGDSGPGCFSANPLFEYGYYLGNGSPCIDVGSVTAVAAGLAGYTTRVNGANDTGTADIGYHYFSGMNLDYADLYVAPPPLGNDGNVGTNPAAPLATITAAIGKSMNGTKIHVAAGNYVHGSETFPISIKNKSGLQLLGEDRYTTVVNAAGSAKQVLIISNAPNTRIERFTFRGGYISSSASALYGGGLYINNCSGLIISDCMIISNHLQSTLNHGQAYGGGIFVIGGNVTLEKSIIANNKAYSYGDFATDSGKGGGVCAFGTLAINSCAIYDNLTDNVYMHVGLGAGIYANGLVNMRNTLLHRNTALQYGDAIYVAGGVLKIENCTVADHATDGIYKAGGSVTVTNSILWNNGDDIVGTGVLLGYSCVEDGDNNGTNGCIMANPLFEDASAANYRIKPLSPCRDSAIWQAWMANASDLADKPRVVGNKPDMGCYESQYRPGSVFMVK